MKRLSIFRLIFFLPLFIIGYTSAIAGERAHPPELRIVKVKPVRPHGHFYKPSVLKRGHVWQDGRWQWNKRKHSYVWVKGHSAKRKHGKTWENGHWSKVRGGWIYHPGFWA